MIAKVLLVFSIYLLSSLSVSLSQQYKGDQCTVIRTGQAGICKLVTDCKAVQDEIRKKIQPTKCGFEGRVQVVCCPLGFIAQKCHEYGKSAFEVTTLFSPDGEENQVKQDKCGFKVSELIVNGDKASIREFPHQALIGYGEDPDVKYLCGGSLVSEKYVLTAGHCRSFDGINASYVRLGELNLKNSSLGSKPETFRIVSIIAHPDYKRSAVYNDITLLLLNRAVVFSPYIYPICLPQQFEITQKKAIASGFGAVGFAENSSDHLLKATLDIFSYQACNESFMYDTSNRNLNKGIIDATQLCAGSFDDDKDACQGDSGGPLQVYNTEVYCTYNLIGIVSFGKGCGTAGQPGIYTRVYSYMSWITGIIWNTTYTQG